MRDKIKKLEARESAILEQQAALDKELLELKASLGEENQKLAEGEAKLVKLQASEFPDPILAVAA
eukprot:4394922-Pyramimonas_sp.AAC.1